MKKSLALICTLLFIAINGNAQITGMSLAGRDSKTDVGRTSVYGPSSVSYKKIHADGCMIFELIQNAGEYMYWQMNPFYIAYAFTSNNVPPLVIKPSVINNAPFQATDFNITHMDWSAPIIGKDNNFNIGLGYTFLLKAEGIGMSSVDGKYQGMTKTGLRFDGDFSYGGGPFNPKIRVGIGPIIDAKYVNRNETFAIRTAAGSALYGGKGGTYNFVEGDLHVGLNEHVYLTVKAKKFTKLFSISIDEFEDVLTERLGDQVKIKTREFSVGLLFDMDFGWLSKVTGAFEN